MAKVVKKKKKKKKIRSMGGTGAARVTSNLRPRYTLQTPPCADACPCDNDIRGFLTAVSQYEKRQLSLEQAYEKGWRTVVETNPIPSIIGRVCPHPCEDGCNRAHLDEAVSINKVERSLGDWALEKGLKFERVEGGTHPEKIAVVGSGPAGLSCAYQLARQGYSVTIFEAFGETGGMLRWGIPDYRLPRNIIDREVQRIVELGVELKLNTRIGVDVSFERLKQDFQAIFVGIGAHKGKALRAPGEESENVFTGAEFLHRINAGETIDVGNDVVVIGGGDSAIDAARVSRRLGAHTTILYRRTEKEMPAITHEIEEAKDEGVNFEFLAAPTEVITEGNRAVSIKCIRMELKELDSSGRPRPVPIEGSEYTRSVSTLIPAISQEPDFAGLEMLKAGPREWIHVKDLHCETTTQDNVWAGGDVLDLALVTTAIGHGRRAAESIHAKLREQDQPTYEKAPIITHDKMRIEHYDKKARNNPAALSIEERLANPHAEIVSRLPEAAFRDEAARCLSCGKCYDCERCWMYCQDNAVSKVAPFTYEVDMNKCQGCKKCAEECPCGFIIMV